MTILNRMLCNESMTFIVMWRHILNDDYDDDEWMGDLADMS